jgi:hypothetical protein
MKKNILLILFIHFIVILSAQNNHNELVPNPNFQLSFDEAKFRKVSKDLDLPENVLMLKAREIQQYKDKIAQLNRFDYFQLNAWENCLNTDRKTFATNKANDAYWFFKLSQLDKDGIYCRLKEPLQARRQYEIRIKYRYLAEVEKKNLSRLPALKVWLGSDKYLKISQLIEVGKLFPNRSTRMEDAKRRKIIMEFQQNYGGFYSDDFAETERIPEWQEVKFKYTATGNEQFILLGYFLSKQNKNHLPSNLFCDIDEVSVKLFRTPGTRED